MPIRILSVGQCGVDGPAIQQRLHEVLQATVIRAENKSDALKQLDAGAFDLVMVNRVLAADRSSGQAVIEAIEQRDNPPPVMLISDLDDAQQQAIHAGAAPGFGKSAIDDDETIVTRIREAIGKK